MGVGNGGASKVGISKIFDQNFIWKANIVPKKQLLRKSGQGFKSALHFLMATKPRGHS